MRRQPHRLQQADWALALPARKPCGQYSTQSVPCATALAQVRATLMLDGGAGASSRSSLGASASGSDACPGAARSGGSRSSPATSSG
jgi:hypothetical protein